MVPLADRMRPANLKEYVGQKHLLSPDKLLYKSIIQKQLFSAILWGPPGVGKTTLARIIATESGVEFYEFSAVRVGIPEIKKIIDSLTHQNIPPIIFVDEIHRFNKAQQDAFLPIVESGKIILIGATTENPSFEIINALLSRMRVLTLSLLESNDLSQILDHALSDPVRGIGENNVLVEPEARETLIASCQGDARHMLNTLEISYISAQNDQKGIVNITSNRVTEALQSKVLAYDKNGEEHYNTISAFIKSMRASNPDAALYYLARMVESGEDPKFIARRMVIFASEDIGMAQPTAIVIANEVFKACQVIGYPECAINLAHGTVYLAKAKKDRSAYDAYFKAVADVKLHGNLPIPKKILNAPTKLMKQLDYGEGYQMYGDDDFLPEKLKGKKYWNKNNEK